VDVVSLPYHQEKSSDMTKGPKAAGAFEETIVGQGGDAPPLKQEAAIRRGDGCGNSNTRKSSAWAGVATSCMQSLKYDFGFGRCHVDDRPP
jgi:hypothetical protein